MAGCQSHLPAHRPCLKLLDGAHPALPAQCVSPNSPPCTLAATLPRPRAPSCPLNRRHGTVFAIKSIKN